MDMKSMSILSGISTQDHPSAADRKQVLTRRCRFLFAWAPGQIAAPHGKADHSVRGGPAENLAFLLFLELLLENYRSVHFQKITQIQWVK